MRRIVPALLLLVLCSVLPAAGQGILNPTISGNEVSLEVSLAGIGIDVTIRFAEVTGLSLENLGVSAHLVNPLSPAFRARLPNGVVPALPLVLRIEPPANGSLSFTGTSEIDIHTHNLNFYIGTPLRFFSSPVGGAFHDVTTAMGPGSYRARATKGGFSEFLIVLDLRSLNTAIAGKFDRLEDLLDAYHGSMPGSVYYDLEERLEDARAAWTGGNKQAAIAELDDFLEIVEEHSGTDIPNVWRAARDVENAAGYLSSAAQTLRFSLGLKGLLGLGL